MAGSIQRLLTPHLYASSKRLEFELTLVSLNDALHQVRMMNCDSDLELNTLNPDSVLKQHSREVLPNEV